MARIKPGSRYSVVIRGNKPNRDKEGRGDVSVGVATQREERPYRGLDRLSGIKTKTVETGLTASIRAHVSVWNRRRGGRKVEDMLVSEQVYPPKGERADVVVRRDRQRVDGAKQEIDRHVAAAEAAVRARLAELGYPTKERRG